MCEDDQCDEEYLEDGQEYCPICKQLNWPGAMETCEHYAGALCDGKVIWSDDFEAFNEAVSDLQCIAEDKYDWAEMDLALPEFLEAGKKANTPKTLIKLVFENEFDASLVFQCSDTFQEGPWSETVGMCSSAGSGLYHEDPGFTKKLTKHLRALAEALQAETSTADE